MSQPQGYDSSPSQHGSNPMSPVQQPFQPRSPSGPPQHDHRQPGPSFAGQIRCDCGGIIAQHSNFCPKCRILVDRSRGKYAPSECQQSQFTYYMPNVADVQFERFAMGPNTAVPTLWKCLTDHITKLKSQIQAIDSDVGYVRYVCTKLMDEAVRAMTMRKDIMASHPILEKPGRAQHTPIELMLHLRG